MGNDRQSKNTNPNNNIGGAAGINFPRKGELCLSSVASPILEGFFMDSLGTYIYLFRKVRNTSFYKDSYALHLAIHCLLKANRFAKQVIIGNQVIDVEVGQFITGRHKLHLETGIKESTIKNKLFLLSKVRFVDIKTTTKYSIVTVINYEKYQLTLENRPAVHTTEQPTKEHNKESIRKIKKEKNIEIPPPLDTIKEYFKELVRPEAAEPFYDYYQSNGWKVGKNTMKDWRAAARNWCKRDFDSKSKGGSGWKQP